MCTVRAFCNTFLLPKQCSFRLVKCSFSTDVGLKLENDDRPSKHMYKTYSFNNHRDLAVYFSDNIIFKDKSLIVLNKPYGLKKSKDAGVSRTPLLESMNNLSMDEVLPHLEEILHIPKLYVIKYPERFTSGVMLLGTNEDVKHVIQKRFRTKLESPFTYTAVCVGIPITQSDSQRLGLTVVGNPDKKCSKKKEETSVGSKTVSFVSKWSIRSTQLGKVKTVRLTHKTLSTNEDLNVSAVEIQTNTNKWHCVRAYLASRLLTPVLGDNIYGSAVKYIQGKALPVDPFSALAHSPQVLPSEILKALKVSNDQSLIPVHLHLSRVTISRYGNKTITLDAKQPEYFSWTCERLALDC